MEDNAIVNFFSDVHCVCWVVCGGCRQRSGTVATSVWLWFGKFFERMFALMFLMMFMLFVGSPAASAAAVGLLPCCFSF